MDGMRMRDDAPQSRAHTFDQDVVRDIMFARGSKSSEDSLSSVGDIAGGDFGGAFDLVHGSLDLASQDRPPAAPAFGIQKIHEPGAKAEAAKIAHDRFHGILLAVAIPKAHRRRRMRQEFRLDRRSDDYQRRELGGSEPDRGRLAPDVELDGRLRARAGAD